MKNMQLFHNLCKQELSKKETPEKEEDRFTGTVTWKAYFDYWKAGAGIPMILLLVILTVGTQVNKAIFFQCLSLGCTL